MTEIFAWGYTAYMTQNSEGFELSGYIDGKLFDIVARTTQQAEKSFARAARRAWLRRKIGRVGWRPCREHEPMCMADTYHDVSVATLVFALLKVLVGRVRG